MHFLATVALFAFFSYPTVVLDWPRRSTLLNTARGLATPKTHSVLPSVGNLNENYRPFSACLISFDCGNYDDDDDTDGYGSLAHR